MHDGTKACCWCETATTCHQLTQLVGLWLERKKKSDKAASISWILTTEGTWKDARYGMYRFAGDSDRTSVSRGALLSMEWCFSVPATLAVNNVCLLTSTTARILYGEPGDIQYKYDESCLYRLGKMDF